MSLSLLLFAVLSRADSILDFYISKDLAIGLTYYPEYALSESLNDFSPTPFGAYHDFDEYSRRAVIIRNGDGFNLKINNKAVCVNSNQIKACKEPTIFTIKEYTNGYRIEYKDKCMTADPKLTMQNCDGTGRYQSFYFKDETKRYCDEENQSEEETTQIEEETKKEPEQIRKAEKKKEKILKDAIKKHKPGKKMKKLMKKLWKWNWKMPNLNIC